MNTPDPQFDDLILALREDLPSDAEQERTRARLTAAGVTLGSALVVHHLTTQAASLPSTTLATKLGVLFTKGATALEGSAQGVGLSLASWGAATKSALAVTAVAVAAGYPVVDHLRTTDASRAVSVAPSLPPPAEPGARSALRQGIPTPVTVPNTVPDTLPSTVPNTVFETDLQKGLAAAPQIERDDAPKTSTTAAPSARGKQHTVARSVAEALPAARAVVVERQPAGGSHAMSPVPTVSAAEEHVATPEPLARAPLPAEAQTTYGLQVETQLLERALAALGQEDYTAAQRWLDEHRRRFPTGVLAPERSRLRARLPPSISKVTKP